MFNLQQCNCYEFALKFAVTTKFNILTTEAGIEPQMIIYYLTVSRPTGFMNHLPKLELHVYKEIITCNDRTCTSTKHGYAVKKCVWILYIHLSMFHLMCYLGTGNYGSPLVPKQDIYYNG